MNRTPNSKELARLRGLVTSDPEIMRGTPVFKGARIPVDVVALAQGATAEEILEGYPNEEMLSRAPIYSRAFSPANRLPGKRKSRLRSSPSNEGEGFPR